MKHLIKPRDSSFQKFINKVEGKYNMLKINVVTTCLIFFDSLLIKEKHSHITLAKRHVDKYFLT